MGSRNEMVSLARSWLGKNEKDGSYKEIIDIYNSFKGQLPRNLKMQYGWSWCACTWSALAIKLGYTDFIPIEISCGLLIEKAKEMDIWVELDGYIPKPGDAILYDWQDTGKGDNTGWPDHIGIVEYVNQDSGYFVVIEGNYSDSVKKRTISINGKFIRGFITPKYDNNSTTSNPPLEKGKDIQMIAREVISGLWGNGEERKQRLEKCGYDYQTIRGKVNDILNSTKGSDVISTCSAKEKSYKLIGTYITMANVYCRNDAGTNKKALCLIPKGTKVLCYGYYNRNNGSNWLYITFKLDDIRYTGFTHEKYLKKISF